MSSTGPLSRRLPELLAKARPLVRRAATGVAAGTATAGKAVGEAVEHVVENHITDVVDVARTIKKAIEQNQRAAQGPGSARFLPAAPPPPAAPFRGSSGVIRPQASLPRPPTFAASVLVNKK